MRFKLGVVGLVPLRIPGELSRPVVGVRSRRDAVLGAGVPKAPIDEHRYMRTREYGVGSTTNLGDWANILAESETTTVKSAP
jgi:hypothetical protein